MSQKLKIAGAALNQTPLDFKANYERIIAAIEQAKQDEVAVLALPELCISGYNCEDMFFADWVIDESAHYLDLIAQQAVGIAVVVGLPMVVEGIRYNVAAFCSAGKVQGFTVKHFLANEGIHYETRWFTPYTKENRSVTWNDEKLPFGKPVYTLHGGEKIAIEICEDGWRGTARPMYYYANQGADVLVHINASHFAMGKKARRKSIAKETNSQGLAVVYVNMLGNESGESIYDGDVIISDATGYYLEASRFNLTDINYLASFVDIKTSEKLPPFTSPIEVSEDDKFLEFTMASTLGLWDYLRKSKCKGFTLSLSGGADSAACAILVKLMFNRLIESNGIDFIKQSLGLEAENEAELFKKVLITVYQSTVNSGKTTENAAAALASEIGACHYQWSVDDSIQTYVSKVEGAVNQNLTWDKFDLSLQNIQARGRAPGIWLMANMHNHLLLTTSNRSEGNVGYCTMDGDTAGSLAPLGGVSKHFIKKWLVWVADWYGIKSAADIAGLPPTAELRPVAVGGIPQTDEADLMPYYLLEEIERLLIFHKLSSATAIEKLRLSYPNIPLEDLEAYVQKFKRLWAASQWKRVRLAPSFHLDDFNINPRSGLRYPILNGGLK